MPTQKRERVWEASADYLDKVIEILGEDINHSWHINDEQWCKELIKKGVEKAVWAYRGGAYSMKPPPDKKRMTKLEKFIRWSIEGQQYLGKMDDQEISDVTFNNRQDHENTLEALHKIGIDARISAKDLEAREKGKKGRDQGIRNFTFDMIIIYAALTGKRPGLSKTSESNKKPGGQYSGHLFEFYWETCKAIGEPIDKHGAFKRLENGLKDWRNGTIQIYERF